MFSLETKHNSFSFEITGYQFPQITEGYDANWLIIGFNVSTRQYQWQISNSCLLTWDVICLMNWLRKIAHDEPLPYEEFTGLEIDLSIQYRGKEDEQYKLRIKLRYGCIPLEIIEKEGIDKRIRLDFKVDAEGLERMADAIEKEIKCYPPRGELGRKWLELINAKERRGA